ncbi:MAG TPA: hypothetical protein VK674_06960 [Candidatus Limnocylindria bacterium]|nr:hypothetical protein [Candidatus Limnocylindria bacterium]
MAVHDTKKAKKAKVPEEPEQLAKKEGEEDMKKTRKLPGFFSLRNKKFVAVLALAVGLAGLGSYGFYRSSTSALNKDTRTVGGCRNTNTVLRYGSSGSCVKVVQTILNRSHAIYPDARNYWPQNLTEDGDYGLKTTGAVQGYQRFANKKYATRVYDPNPPLESDGIVGSRTYEQLQVNTCADLRAHDLSLPECR